MKQGLRRGGVELLESIRPLWEELNNLHAAKSPFFGDDYRAFTFEVRKKTLEEKATKGNLRISIYVEKGDKIVGYCIASIDGAEGEIDSIYVKKEKRRSGVGKILMEDCLEWLKENGSERIKVVVVYGNEETFAFYKKFGLFPRATTLTTLKWHTG
jgi:ribosomal protein S18 acetylase RimI-like enzyme